MDRRQYLHESIFLLSFAQFPRRWFSRLNDPFLDIWQANDQVLSEVLSRQNLEKGQVEFGGFPDRYDIYQTGSASSYLMRMMAAWQYPESSHFHSDELVMHMEAAIQFLLNRQHQDGTIDLLTTNFHSTPDLAFVVEPLSRSYIVANKLGFPSERLKEQMDTFLRAAGNALVVGGIHTPNHRWVVSMALSLLYTLYREESYIHRINQWLQEGIDMDEEGQYTERSAGVYSPLTNRCLITIADCLNKPELLEPVRRNLEMTQYLFHPDGTIASQISRRFDRSQTRNAAAYWISYAYLAQVDRSMKWQQWAESIWTTHTTRELSGQALYFLQYPAIWKRLVKKDATPALQYSKYFPGLGLYRYREQDWDLTILSEHSTIASIRKGQCGIHAIRMASAFFGKGQFQADEMEVSENRIILKQSLSAPYYQPLDSSQIDPTGDWEKMPRDLRTQSEIQELTASVIFEVHADTILLQVDISGTDHVPVAVEFNILNGNKIEGVSTWLDEEPDVLFPESDHITIRDSHQAIQVSGLDQQHSWSQLRGADPKLPGNSVYLTGYTPFQRSIKIQ